MARHNELCDGVSDLAIKVFIPTHVRDKPKIYIGCDVSGGKKKLKGSPSKDKGELKEGIFTRYLLMQGTNSIQDMRVINNDATFYQSKTSEN